MGGEGVGGVRANCSVRPARRRTAGSVVGLLFQIGCGQQAESILSKAGDEIHRHPYVRVQIEPYERVGERITATDGGSVVLMGPAQRVRIDTNEKCLACEGERGQWFDRNGDSPTSSGNGIEGCGVVMALGMVAKEPVLGYARLLGSEWWREVYGHDAELAMHRSEVVDGRACYVISIRTSEKRGGTVWWWIEKRRGVFVQSESVPASVGERSKKIIGVRYALISFPVHLEDSEFRVRAGAVATRPAE